MKQWIAIFLALVLTLCCSACLAQERTRTVFIGGDEEEITQTRYQSADGYSLWYDANVFKLGDEADGVVTFSPLEIDALMPVSLTICAVDAPADTLWDLIIEVAADHAQAGWAMGEITQETLESGLAARACEGVKDGVISRFILVEGAGFACAVTATFPEEAVEGYGARLNLIVQTIGAA